MDLIVLGTNHKYSSLSLREKLSFSKKKTKEALYLLKEKNILNGAIILSTCNRTEIYASVKDANSSIKEIEEFICFYQGLKKCDIFPYLYRYRGSEALRHLFCVASGMDSLILGERQITGQVKEALLYGKNVEFVDEPLEKMFKEALAFARRVHRDTKISQGKVSIGSIAIDFIKEKLTNLCGKSILIIGVGKVTELILKYLKKEKLKVVFISNRTFEKAKYLADKIGAKAVNFNEFDRYLNEADVIISATRSPNFILKKDVIESSKRGELLILDLAVPRDVEPSVKQIKGVSLFNLEELNAVIEKNIREKSAKAEIIRNFAKIEAEKLWNKFIELEPEPVRLP